MNRVSPVMCLIVSLILSSATTARSQSRPADFGNQWVRSHPLTLMALTQQNEAVSGNDLYSKAGLNTMLAWKDRSEVFKAAARQKMPWHYHLDHRKGPLSDELKSYVSGLFSQYPGGQGILLWDEPKGNEMADVGKIAEWLRQAHPELLIYTNLNPIPPTGNQRFSATRAGLPAEGNETYPYSYEDSIHDCIDQVRPDVLMTDIYPFWSPETLDPAGYYREKYFLNLSMIREAALQANIPYWMFVQAYQDIGRCRYPSESDVRMQVYSTLAYGFTGIAYFTYDAVEEGSMLDAQFRPAPIYEHIAALNEEVGHLGRPLRFLKSADVRYVPGRAGAGGELNAVPLGIPPYKPNSWTATTITNIAIGKEGPDCNVLAGFFEDDDGGLYFMIVNLRHGENLSAEQAQLPIQLTFAPGIEKLHMLSRITGKPAPVKLIGGRIELTLPGGTGELFKLGDGRFAGMGP